MSLDRKIFYGVFGSLLFTVTTAAVSIVQLKWILLYLPKQAAGTWLLFLTFGSYIAFFDLGLSPTLGREVSFVLGRGRLDSAETLEDIADLIATCALLFRILAVTTFVVSVLVGFLFFSRSHGDTQHQLFWSWVIFSVGASLNLLGSTGFAALFGTGRVATEKLIRSVALVIGLCMSLASLKLGYGVIGLAVAWSLQGLLARVAAWAFLRMQLPELRSIRGHAQIALARNLAFPSFKLAAVQLGAILILQTANLVIASVLGAAAIPPYEAVSKIITTLMTLSLLVVMSSSPFISFAYAANDLDNVRRLLTRNLRYGMAVLILLISFVATFGDRIIQVWLGPNMFVGSSVLWTLLLMVLFEVHHVVYASALMATGRIAFVYTALLAGVLNLVLSFSLAGPLQLWGVALGTLIAQLLTNNWYAPYITTKFFNMSFKALWRQTYLPLIALGLLQTLLNLELRNQLPNLGLLPSMGLSFITSMLVGTALVVGLVLTPEERGSIFGGLDRGRIQLPRRSVD
ncbi:MAG: polysaccharide biosynthesis protein [Acidobacteriales bacterium]|nr:polysaccharide biosynthesis protein [Terriglobales bacterium]